MSTAEIQADRAFVELPVQANALTAGLAAAALAVGRFADKLAEGLGHSGRYEIRDSKAAFQAFSVVLDCAPDQARQSSQTRQEAAIDSGSYYNVSDKETGASWTDRLLLARETLATKQNRTNVLRDRIERRTGIPATT